MTPRGDTIGQRLVANWKVPTLKRHDPHPYRSFVIGYILLALVALGGFLLGNLGKWSTTAVWVGFALMAYGGIKEMCWEEVKHAHAEVMKEIEQFAAISRWNSSNMSKTSGSSNTTRTARARRPRRRTRTETYAAPRSRPPSP